MIFAWTVFIIFAILAILFTIASVYEAVFTPENVDTLSQKMRILTILWYIIASIPASFIF